MQFGEAINVVKNGGRVARLGWNGKGMFIFLVAGSTFQVNRPPLLGIYPEGATINYHPHIDMRMANGKIMPWTPSQADMLSGDWVEIDEAAINLPVREIPEGTVDGLIAKCASTGERQEIFYGRGDGRYFTIEVVEQIAVNKDRVPAVEKTQETPA